jgi:peroxiredoxin
MLTEGSQAPEVRLQGWSLRDALRNGPVLLVFFKISCPTCQFALPFVQRLDGSGLQIVAISQDDETRTSEFLKHFRLTVRTVIDEASDFAVSNVFRITHVPSLFLIEPDGGEPDGTISLSVEGFNKSAIELLGARFGLAPFGTGEFVPELRPG